MPDSAHASVKDEVLGDPATDRLKEELRNYLRARAERLIGDLGRKLGEGANRLARPGSGPGPLAKGLAGGGKALSEGKSPAGALVKAGTEGLKNAVNGALGKGGPSKSVTISEDIDVGVPVREAYDQWTQFQEFSTFAKGVVSVEQTDATNSTWRVKVAKSTRSWHANVTEQIPDERIAWTAQGAKGGVKGVVTFHRITDDLTRVLLVLEYFPQGLFEKTGNLWRAQGRRARLDLKLYRKFIMMRGEATDGWRGEIRDGEVVDETDDEPYDEDDVEADGTEDEPEAEDEEAYEDEADAEFEPDEDIEPEAEEAEEEPAPRSRRRPAAARS